jgi:hypothetical protein
MKPSGGSDLRSAQPLLCDLMVPTDNGCQSVLLQKGRVRKPENALRNARDRRTRPLALVLPLRDTSMRPVMPRASRARHASKTGLRRPSVWGWLQVQQRLFTHPKPLSLVHEPDPAGE